MKEIRAYRNYGVLAHEGQVIYTATAADTAKVSEETTLVLPEGWDAWDNEAGEQVIERLETGERYMVREILGSWGDKPVLMWYDGQHTHRVNLEEKD